MPRQTAADCDPEVPRDLRLLTERPGIEAIHTWAPDGSAPDAWTLETTRSIAAADLPAGYRTGRASTHSNPNVSRTTVVVRRDLDGGQ